MKPLSQEFVDRCPVENGFRERGSEMTRIEVFVDAAFAFAVTMLVISFDHIPETYAEVIVAIKHIPAFVLAVVQLVWIWYEHARWSQRYGLESAVSVVLSTALLIVVLIYIYPLRIMMGGMLRWFTQGYLPSGFDLDTMDQLSVMFVFLGIGFTSLGLIFMLMHRYARSQAAALRLSAFEQHHTRLMEWVWLGIAGTGLLAVLFALTLPGDYVPLSGFAFMLIGAWIPLVHSRMERKAERLGLRPHTVT